MSRIGKRTLAAAFCIVAAGLGAAGGLGLVQARPPTDAAAERERIAAERLAAQARLAQDETECRTRFNAMPCLEASREAHRGKLRLLREQELLLAERERKARAAQRDEAVKQRRIAAETRR
jgi:hypothetical protein